MSITLSALQRQRRDTAANWTAENPTLLAGEIGVESDTGYWKIGNGSTAWASLGYVRGTQLSAYPLTNADIASNAEIAVSKLADGTARQLLQTAANGNDVEWTSNIDVPGTLDVTGAATFDNNVIIQGDLTVNGTETIINTQTLDVEDKNIVIGKVTTPSDVTADGGGITLKGTTDKTISWLDATDAWTLSEHVNIASAKEYRIAGTKVLDATSLGSGVTGSSLTSVGTIGTGTWQGSTIATGYGGTGQTTYTDGQLLIGKTDGTLAKATITAGSGISVTNGNGSISISATGAGVTSISQGDTKAEVIDTGTDGRFVVTTENSERLRVDNVGRVGIGVTPSTIDSTASRGVLALDGGTSVAFWASIAGTGKGTFQHDGTNAILYNSANGYLAFGTNNTERLRISSSGAITTSNDITLNAQSDLRFADADSSNWVAFQGPASITSNVTWTLPSADGTSGQVLSTNGSGTLSWATASGGGGSSITQGNTTAEVIDTGSDGRFVVTTEGSERARIDSSGRLLVGTSTSLRSSALVQIAGTNYPGFDINSFGSSSACELALRRARGTQGSPTVVASGDTVGVVYFQGYDGANHITAATIQANIDATPGTNDMPGRLVFSVSSDGSASPTERMRVRNDGWVGIFSATETLSLRSAAAASSTSAFLDGRPSATNTTDGGSSTIKIYTNGNVFNTNNSYGSISDIKLKENIVDANSQWNDLKALQVRNYNFKEGQTHTQIGLIAQEVELVSPGLVSETPDRDEDGNDLGTVTKSVNYSVLYMKAVKALQEAMERIEALEAKVAAFEAS